MGVWIETVENSTYQVSIVSHPVWVCGLKLCDVQAGIRKRPSHPVWVCGLKPSICWN